MKCAKIYSHIVYLFPTFRNIKLYLSRLQQSIYIAACTKRRQANSKHSELQYYIYKFYIEYREVHSSDYHWRQTRSTKLIFLYRVEGEHCIISYYTNFNFSTDNNAPDHLGNFRETLARSGYGQWLPMFFYSPYPYNYIVYFLYISGSTLWPILYNVHPIE